jgi:Ulp1 family protease
VHRISREEDNNPDSNVHFFTSHFMTTLKNEGPKAVESWTVNKNINVFQKKLIFIPVNADLHWSMCVVVNPGIIANSYEENIAATKEHAW